MDFTTEFFGASARVPNPCRTLVPVFLGAPGCHCPTRTTKSQNLNVTFSLKPEFTRIKSEPVSPTRLRCSAEPTAAPMMACCAALKSFVHRDMAYRRRPWVTRVLGRSGSKLRSLQVDFSVYGLSYLGRPNVLLLSVFFHQFLLTRLAIHFRCCLGLGFGEFYDWDKWLQFLVPVIPVRKGAINA